MKITTEKFKIYSRFLLKKMDLNHGRKGRLLQKWTRIVAEKFNIHDSF